MKKLNSHLYKAAAVAAATLFIGNADAQTSSLYFMKWNPQQHLLNPAFQPKGKFYFGLPALSYMDFQAGNSDLVFSDIIQNVTVNGQKKTVLFIDRDAKAGSVDDYLDALSDGTRVFYEHRINLLNCGFKTNLGFFSFDLSNRANTSILIPKSLSVLALKGMNEGETFVIDGKDIAADATVFSQLAIGLSRPINEDLTVGAKLKFLYGHADVHTKFKDLKITGNENEWAIKGDADIMAAVPGLTIKEKPDGQIDDIDFDDDNADDFAKPQGKGFAVDLGATYKVRPNITVSASVIDLGFMRWNNNLHKIKKVNDFVWDGIEYDINNDTTNYGKKYEEMFEAMFRQDADAKAYNTWLNTKIFLGGEYSLWQDRIGFGALARGEVYQGKFYGNGVLSANFRPWRQLSASLTYGVFDGHWNNLGAGLNINAGPINMFLNAEHIPLKYAKDDAIIIPSNTNQFQLCMGANIYIGYSKKRELKEMNGKDGIIDSLGVYSDSAIVANIEEIPTDTTVSNATDEGDVWIEDPQNELPVASKMTEPEEPKPVVKDEVKVAVKEETKVVKEEVKAPVKETAKEVKKTNEAAKTTVKNEVKPAAKEVKKTNEATKTTVKNEVKPAVKEVKKTNEAAKTTVKNEVKPAVKEVKKTNEAAQAVDKNVEEIAKTVVKEEAKVEEVKAVVKEETKAAVTEEPKVEVKEEAKAEEPTTVSSTGEPSEIATSELASNLLNIKKESSAKIKFIKDPSTIALDPSSYATLDKLVEVMNNDKNLNVGIYCHSSLVKNKNHTYFITEERANVVRGYLVEKGIDYSRIKTVGMGNDQPNPFGDNTRTEIKFFR